jgi:hypothetical protein
MNLRSQLILGLGLPLLMAGSLSGWLWTGLTAQPSGLTPIPAERNTYDRHERLLNASNKAWLDLSRQPRNGAPRIKDQIRISRAQLQDVIAHDIARSNEDKRAGQVLQAIAVQIHQGRLRTITRLNLQAIEVGEMNGSSRVALLRLLKRLPLLSQQALVVTIEGHPVIRDANTIGLDKVWVQVGNFRWTIAEASRYLQVPESYIQDIIRRELTLVPMGKFRRLEVEPDALVFTGDRTAW